jgi:hypothetical protein
MKITDKDLAGPPKKIGEYKGRPVMESATRGGFHFIYAINKSGETETLGTGSLSPIARFVAMKENPELVLSQLQKSEELPKWVTEKLAIEEGAFEVTKQFKAVEASLAKK